MSKTFKIQNNDISDGYHTFDELYEHRVLLYLNLCLHNPDMCAFKCDFENWFCLYFESPCGQISYHIPNKYLGVVRNHGVKEVPNYKWDGHTSVQVIERLTNYLDCLSDKRANHIYGDIYE